MSELSLAEIYAQNEAKIKKIESEVFLCVTELNGGKEFRLWTSGEKVNFLRRVAGKNGFGNKKLYGPPRFPFFVINENQYAKILESGVVEKHPQEWMSEAAEVEPEKIEPAENFAEEKISQPGGFCCDRCGSLDGWLPRMPGIDAGDLSNWVCANCKPFRNASIVADRCGPAVEAEAAEEAFWDVVESQTIVVAMESAACVNCGSSWVIERPTVQSVERVCWCCQSTIDAGAFHVAISSPPPWRGKNFCWYRVQKRMDANNGESQELPGGRRRTSSGRQRVSGRSKNERVKRESRIQAGFDFG